MQPTITDVQKTQNLFSRLHSEIKNMTDSGDV
jgi:hypothetical protein